MRNGGNGYEALQCICCSCVVIGGIGHAREDSSPHRKRINLQHLAAECQDTVDSPPALLGSALSCGPWTSPSLQPPHQRELENCQPLFPGSSRSAADPVPPVSCQGIFLAAMMPFSGPKCSQNRSWGEKKQEQTQSMRSWFRWKPWMAKTRVALDSRYSHMDHSSQPNSVVWSYVGFEETHFQFNVCAFEQPWSSRS